MFATLDEVRRKTGAITVLPRTEAPAYVRGAFNYGVTVYTVARKGGLTAAVRCAGYNRLDTPRDEGFTPDAPRLLVVEEYSGNRAWTRVTLYAG